MMPTFKTMFNDVVEKFKTNKQLLFLTIGGVVTLLGIGLYLGFSNNYLLTLYTNNFASKNVVASVPYTKILKANYNNNIAYSLKSVTDDIFDIKRNVDLANTDLKNSASDTAAAVTDVSQQFDNIKRNAISDIDLRIKRLNDALTLFGSVKYLNSSEIINVKADLAADITNLNLLKSKIDKDTDIDTLKSDRNSIRDGYRVISVIIPKINILVGNDSFDDAINILSGIYTEYSQSLDNIPSWIDGYDKAQTDLATFKTGIDDLLTTYNNIHDNVMPVKIKYPDIAPNFPNNKLTLQTQNDVLSKTQSRLTIIRTLGEQINDEINKLQSLAPSISISGTKISELILNPKISPSKLDLDGTVTQVESKLKKLRDSAVANLSGKGVLEPDDYKDKEVMARIHTWDKHNSDIKTGWVATMNMDPKSTTLWSDLPITNNPDQLSYMYNRLGEMALSYTLSTETSESAYYTDKAKREDLKNHILYGLDWMYEHIAAFKDPSIKNKYGNWYVWRIGLPLYVNSVTVLMYGNGALTKDKAQRYMDGLDKISPSNYLTDSGTEFTAANKAWIAGILLVKGINRDNMDDIAQARLGLSALYPYTNASDGFYLDGSFIQHNSYAYNGAYGNDQFITMAGAIQLMGQGGIGLHDNNASNIINWIDNSFQPFMYKGVIMDMVRGRVVSRESYQDYFPSYFTVNSMLQVLDNPIVTKSNKVKIESLIKYTINNDPMGKFIQYVPLSLLGKVRKIQNDNSIPAYNPKIDKVFPRMDRAVHLNSNWGIGISLSSSRTAKYETLNPPTKPEDLFGWYSADGMTYVYTDSTQFNGNYWPTVDPYRLPGTTIDTQARTAREGQGEKTTNTWAGGASLDNYTVAGLDLNPSTKNFVSALRGKKSWFTFDNEIVALGAGLTDTSNNQVETIIENRKLNLDNSNSFVVGTSKSVTTMPNTLGETRQVGGTFNHVSKGWNPTMTDTKWAYLSGFGGYYFPKQQPGVSNIVGLREKRVSNWTNINSYYTNDTPVFNNYLTLYFNHGVNPTGANQSYEYVLLPNMSQDNVKNYADNPAINIIRNDVDVQAVEYKGKGVYQMNIWKEGTKVNDIVSDKPVSIIETEINGLVKLSVSDPTQKQTSVVVTVDKKFKGASPLSIPSNMKMDTSDGNIKITMDLTNTNGTSQIVSFPIE